MFCPGSTSMAASSASAVCLEAREVLGWFPDPAQKREILIRFGKARTETELHPDAWARANWAAACSDIRAVMQETALADTAFDFVCDLLEQHRKVLEEKPGNHKPGQGTRRAGKRKHGTASLLSCSDQHVLAPPCSAEYDPGESMTPPCSAEADPAQRMTLPDQHTRPGANSSGLDQARLRSKRAPQKVVTRRNQLEDHLLAMASDGQPISVRTLYDTFRGALGMNATEMDSSKLRTALQGICNCNDVAGVEYLILKTQHEDPVREFTPTDKKTKQEAPQYLAGTAPVGDKILHYYKSSVPRGYSQALARRKRANETQEAGAPSENELRLTGDIENVEGGHE
eukprot:CAMPEP_0172188636 /NCGR_PEP_ID=MMETSP1050-20130122/22047_1 /TAXON_ID=233186 /ORGANISM="Cryptomonas curvata, Strain CCAP979/52" /LENGTH=341 /DNA_ID=CAMNT_0012863179 /DNA_START=195 /DNA_END=1220 /DNA_ORIENTATION=+